MAGSMGRFRGVLRDLRNLHKIERDKAKRAYIDAMIEDQQLGIEHFAEEIFEAKMIGVRNPAFEGDMVGWLDDDFDDDEDGKDRPKPTGTV